MSDIGKSLLEGARQALAYAKGAKPRTKVHKENNIVMSLAGEKTTQKHDIKTARERLAKMQ
jgi:hypothetical protein